MNLLKDPQTNWRYIAGIAVLGLAVSAGVLWYQGQGGQDLKILKVKMPEKISESEKMPEIIPPSIKANMNEDGTLSLQYVHELVDLGPERIEYLPFLEHDLRLYTSQIEEREAYDMFLLRGGYSLNGEISNTEKQQELFINYTSLIKALDYTLIPKAMAVDAAIRSVEGTLRHDEYGIPIYGIENFTELGIMLPLSPGDTLWLWSEGKQWEATLESLAVRLSGNYSGITIVVTVGGSFQPGLDFILSLKPFPKQTWKTREPSPSDNLVAQEFIQELNAECDEKELERVGGDCIPPHVTVIQTETQGDFMLIRGAGIAAGEGVKVSEMFLRKTGSDEWKGFIGSQRVSNISYPFVDVDGDGVPEFSDQNASFGDLKAIFPEEKIILSYSSGQ